MDSPPVRRRRKPWFWPLFSGMVLVALAPAIVGVAIGFQVLNDPNLLSARLPWLTLIAFLLIVEGFTPLVIVQVAKRRGNNVGTYAALPMRRAVLWEILQLAGFLGGFAWLFVNVAMHRGLLFALGGMVIGVGIGGFAAMRGMELRARRRPIRPYGLSATSFAWSMLAVTTALGVVVLALHYLSGE